MKKICSIIVLTLLALIPVQNAMGLTVSVIPKPQASVRTVCVQTTGGKLCIPTGIPNSSAVVPTKNYRVVMVKINGQPVTVSRTSTSAIPVRITPPAPVAAPAPVASEDRTNSMQQEMLEYINSDRARANAPALVLDSRLSDGAYLKSKDMAFNGYFDHTSPSYGSPFDMMKSLGITYRTAGENIAKHTSVKGAHDAFMNSPGHKANILNNNYTKVGLGFYTYGNYLYITEWFTN